MLAYLFKRMLTFIPTLLLLTVVAFLLSKSAPGDPVDLRLGMEGMRGMAISPEDEEARYEEVARTLGLHLPVFYFRVGAAAYPDTLYRIIRGDRRAAVRELISRYGYWPAIQAYYRQVQRLYQLGFQRDSMSDSLAVMLSPAVQRLLVAGSPELIERHLAQLPEAVGNGKDPVFQEIAQLRRSWKDVKEKADRSQLYLPHFHWYGLNNQYHRWLSRFIRGDFGISLQDGRPASATIGDALKWTLLLNGIPIILAFGLSIPIGIFLARHWGSLADSAISGLLFVLFALPTFWVATMLLVFLTTPQYGLDLFPTLGPGSVSELGDSFWSRFGSISWHLTLPVFCLTYPLLAVLARQMRASMREALKQEYVRAARARGLSERSVVWKHAFRNALFPIITLLGNALPGLMAGAVLIEVIFSIHGIGRLMLRSIFAQDWAVVYTILVVGSALTLLGILLADIGYALADPRVKLAENHSGS